MRIVSWLLLICLASSLAAAENWPEYRGPSGDGRSRAKQLPITFGEEENVVWKNSIDGKAWSSPVVWDDQIWVTNATQDGKRLSALCFDAASGKQLADITVKQQSNPPFCYPYNSYASCTPAIEAGRIYVHYGSMATACIDTNTFRILWRREDLKCDHFRGPGSSVVLDGNKLIVAYDGFDRQFVIAFDKQTGKTIWRHDRVIDWPQKDNGDWKKAYSTATIISHLGRRQVISPAAEVVESLDPETGKRLWMARYGGMNCATRPIYAHGMLFITNGSGGKMLAIRPEGEGDISDKIVWESKKGVPKRPSPIMHKDWLFLLTDNGVLTCSEAKTNKSIWTKRLGGNFDASPLLHKDKIYCLDNKGNVHVVAAAAQFKLLAKNRLGDGFMASPAVYKNSLILRTRSALYRIGE